MIEKVNKKRNTHIVNILKKNSLMSFQHILHHLGVQIGYELSKYLTSWKVLL